jgi:dimethylargininase
MEENIFSKAIVKRPGKSLIQGLTTADLGLLDHEKAFRQHESYITALKQCGLEVIIMEAEEDYPDSVFIEDTALLTSCCAIVTDPGAASRRGETISVKNVLQEYYSNIEEIHSPGTVEAGDIMMVGSHFYIGLSERTNYNGAEQIIDILTKNGMSGSMVELKKVLHLKTGISYLENNNLAATGEFLLNKAFKKFNIIEIPPEESYAANCIWVNGKVLIPLGFPTAKKKIEAAGYPIIEVDVSEFRKLDGGLSCLSLRF